MNTLHHKLARYVVIVFFKNNSPIYIELFHYDVFLETYSEILTLSQQKGVIVYYYLFEHRKEALESYRAIINKFHLPNILEHRYLIMKGVNVGRE